MEEGPWDLNRGKLNPGSLGYKRAERFAYERDRAAHLDLWDISCYSEKYTRSGFHINARSTFWRIRIRQRSPIPFNYSDPCREKDGLRVRSCDLKWAEITAQSL